MPRLRHFWIPCFFLSLLPFLAPNLSTGQEIGFVEDYALAKNREKALEQLVPGTSDYYYFHCLHYQNTDQFDKAEALITAWIKRSGYSNRVRQMRNRQALLNFNNNPEATYKHLESELKLKYNHQREIPQAQRDLATQLNPNLISNETLLKNALSRSRTTSEIETSGLPLIADSRMDKTRRRDLLNRLIYPDYQGLVDLVAGDLGERDSRGFGSLKIHNNLTLEQMDALREKMPKLADNSNFINAYISKLYPSADVNWQADNNEHRAYLLRMWNFVQPLSPTRNSLKAHVLYRILDLDRKLGNFDRKRFMEYLQLPRSQSYANPEMVKRIRSRNHLVNLTADYRNVTRLMPIRSDEPLVRDYLHHFLRDANGFSDFLPYVRDTYLKRQFATVKIVNGLGDVEKWASMLSPVEYKQVLDRVDLDFASTNEEFFGDNENINIKLHTKNIKKLIVKVYEINTFNYYRKFRKEIDTDISLDGLVPNFEATHSYDDAPAIRKLRNFSFEKLTKPGVYVIDFIAGGKSSRALIRRGRMTMTTQPTMAGQQVQVFDHNSTPVKDAKLWISNRNYEPDEKGRFIIPFSNQPSSQVAIVSRGDFSSMQRLSLMREQYQLRAGLFVDREQLIRNEKAKLVIRPRLTVSGVPTSVALLKNVRVTMTTTSLDNISSTKSFDEIALSDDDATEIEFVCPPRLKTISFSLSGDVENLSRNKTESLSASTSRNINQIDTSDAIQMAHLLPTSDGYYLEVRGKTGELRKRQPVRLIIKNRFFKRKVNVDLQSDEFGLVHLGSLKNIDAISAAVAGGQQRSWILDTNIETNYRTLHMKQGETVQLAAPHDLAKVSRSRLTLLEKRNGRFTQDHFDKLSLTNGLIRITDLPAGDFLLCVKPTGRTYQIRIGNGEIIGSAVHGSKRQLEIRNPRPFAITQLTTLDDELVVKVSNPGKDTRVHIIASRYKPRFDTFAAFQEVRDIEPWLFEPSLRKSVYLAGRKIGDEFQYILDRKYAQKFAGNMLERPSLLLAPWSPRDTSNNVETLATGDDFGRVGSEADSDMSRARAGQLSSGTVGDLANLDFLDNQSVALWNQKLDKDGAIKVAADQLKNLQHIRVVVTDNNAVCQRTISTAASDIKVRDLRLAHAMNPEEHYCQTKQTETLSKGDTLKIEDLLSAKFQYFDDLTDVFRLYSALNGSTSLGEFAFLLNWSDLDTETQQAKYSKYACHELNFYLYKKDSSFFEKVVKPHLMEKRDRQFIDKWLLGEDVLSYLDPWHYAKLNSFERILLSQRTEARMADIVRSLNDAYFMKPTDRGKFDNLYDMSLGFAGLDDSGIENYRAARKGKKLSSLQSLNGVVAEMGQPGKPTDTKKGMRFGGGGLGGGGGGRSFSRSSRGGEVRDQIVAGTRMELMEKLSEAPVEMDALGVPASAKPAARGRMIKKLEQLKSKQQSLGRQMALVDNNASFVREQESLGEEFLWYKTPRKNAKTLYRRLPPTKEWIENNYYRLVPESVKPDLVAMNRFWQDFANHRGGKFTSSYFAEANRNLTEMLLALAVLDLPEKAEKPDFNYVNDSMTVSANGPMIALHQQVKPVPFEPGNTTILVSENFFIKADRYRTEKGVRYDKFVEGDFLAHTLYGAQVVITNPTSTPKAIDLLVQIPQGAVVASGSQETRNLQMNLNAFSTKTFEYFFYFPTDGKFTHYPAHVSSDESVLAVAPMTEFNVVDRAAEVDKSSWAYVSQNGSEEEVLEFLRQQNLLRHDLSKIAFRMKDKEFFGKVIELLNDRFIYNHTLWSYGLKHRNADVSREFLTHDSIATKVGKHFESTLLSINPVERDWYYHKEYSPLINARSHKVGATRKILNPIFRGHYLNLLDVLAHRRKLTSNDHLSMTYYLLLQDRIEEAIEHFGQVDTSQLSGTMQYDYCSAYLDMYLEKPDDAARKAEKWVNYPVDLWRNRFQNIMAQVNEIRGGETTVIDKRSNEQQQTALAAKEPNFSFEVESNEVAIRSQNLDKVTVNYYEMDIELLFSRSPFEQDNFDGFSVIRPNMSSQLNLKDTKEKQVFAIPDELKNKNVLVELVAGDQVKSKPYFANSLSVQVIENYGQIRVTHDTTGKGIAKTYVKVYALSQDGKVRFHKDGYTDLRGRFDFVSQSNNPLDNVKKYAILILSEDHGAVVRKANPPAE